jgi:hypothetical protein
MLERLAGKLARSMRADERRKKIMREKFPERVVFARSESYYGEMRLADITGIYAKGQMGDGHPTEDGFSIGSTWYGADRGYVRIVPSDLASKLDAIDEKWHKLAVRRRAILRRAWKAGEPLAMSKAQEVRALRAAIAKAEPEAR